MNGKTSRWVSVKSGVPQGTLMFLIYINDIGENVLSMLKLFADDCILYKAISSDEDCNELQNDLNTIYQWSQKWQMNFNINKMCCFEMFQIYSIYFSSVIS